MVRAVGTATANPKALPFWSTNNKEVLHRGASFLYVYDRMRKADVTYA